MAHRIIGWAEEAGFRLSCQETSLKNATELAHQGSRCLSTTRKLPPPELHCCSSNPGATTVCSPPVTPHLLMWTNAPHSASHPWVMDWKGQMPPCACWPFEAAEAWPLPRVCLPNLYEFHCLVKLESAQEASPECWENVVFQVPASVG